MQGSKRPRSAAAPMARAGLYREIVSIHPPLNLGSVLSSKVSEYLRDGSEHALVDGKEQVGNSGASNARTAEHVAESDVGEIANELSTSVREGQRVAPEEPLEGHDTDGHHGEPD